MGTMARAKYLSLLGANDFHELEDRVVGQVLEALSRAPEAGAGRTLLSKVAERFLIRARPEYVTGTHDGELSFDPSVGMFIIKLCRGGRSDATSRHSFARERFTYAHEFAHRFCFVRCDDHIDDQRWVRAVEAVTCKMNRVDKMNEGINLSRAEEGLCNNIARRLLITDTFLREQCHPASWFDSGVEFTSFVEQAARSLGVSPDCLFVRVQREVEQGRLFLGDTRAVFLIGRNRGPVIQRGEPKLRIISAIIPSSVGGVAVRRAYPGLGWEHFGREALEFVASRLAHSREHSGQTHLDLELRESATRNVLIARLDGWWRTTSGTDAQSRAFLWGALSTSGGVY